MSSLFYWKAYYGSHYVACTTHTLTNASLIYPQPLLHHLHSKSCGRLTSTTWVWTCGQQRTSTPSRRFSKFTTRPGSSSHRHTVCLALAWDHTASDWMNVFFFFILLLSKPNQRYLRAELSDWLLHSWLETGKQNKSLWMPAHVLKESSRFVFSKKKIKLFWN